MFPLSTVLFPGAGLPLHVFEDAVPGPDGGLPRRGRRVRRGAHHPGLGGWRRGPAGRRGHRGPDRPGAPSWRTGGCWWSPRGSAGCGWTGGWPTIPIPGPWSTDLPVGAHAGTGRRDRAIAGAEAAVRRLRSLLSELGEVPALPHDLEHRRRRRGDRLAALRAGARSISSIGSDCWLGRLRADGLRPELCAALAGDVVAMLAEGPRT